MTAAFVAQGAEPAFEPIVGSGPNGTVLHYADNSKVVGRGELVVIDYAAALGGYASDVTRTLPADGTFTAQQRALYEVVLQANLAAVHAARRGRPSPRYTRPPATSLRQPDTRTTSCTASGIIWASTYTIRPRTDLCVQGMVLTVNPASICRTPAWAYASRTTCLSRESRRAGAHRSHPQDSRGRRGRHERREQ